MSLFSHQSASRVACEAAVRFAWLMDPGISSEERITPSAIALVNSAEERLRGIRQRPPGTPAWRSDVAIFRRQASAVVSVL